MIKINHLPILWFAVLAGCATGSVSPGVTLLAGINHYREEMEVIGARPERWPERQRMADFLKNTISATIGRSREFNRLVDLDLRKREFMIELRHLSARPERDKEMKQELSKMNEEVERLRGVVKAQIAAAPLQSLNQQQTIEGIATIGLLTMALDTFSSETSFRGSPTPSTKVGTYVVTDLGSFSSVRTPEGQTYRCSTFVVQDEGAGIRCKPAGR